jgi:hypothetical protein
LVIRRNGWIVLTPRAAQKRTEDYDMHDSMLG